MKPISKKITYQLSLHVLFLLTFYTRKESRIAHCENFCSTLSSQSKRSRQAVYLSQNTILNLFHAELVQVASSALQKLQQYACCKPPNFQPNSSSNFVLASFEALKQILLTTRLNLNSRSIQPKHLGPQAEIINTNLPALVGFTEKLKGNHPFFLGGTHLEHISYVRVVCAAIW